jgi:ubiquinone/menaquinone biosynthesis C-methylase UbiE
MPNARLQASYAQPQIGLGYDLLAHAIFGLVGGLTALREQALEHFAIGPGVRVLELGCGTGGITQRLIARGALVSAVDWSEPMLARARLRAPGARFTRSEITAFEPAQPADVVLFAFVLHELDRAARAQALAVARRALSPGAGRLCVVDFALPSRGLLPKALSALVRGFEPASQPGWSRDMDEELRAAGFAPEPHLSLARGLAVALSAVPQP